MRMILLLLFCSMLTRTAEAQDTVSISGRIIDKSSREPIAYADIYIDRSSIGTIANEEGEFVLSIPAEYLKSALKITHLGYVTYLATLSQMDSLKGLIAMEASPKILDEVVIRPLDPVGIARKAFGNIQNSYPIVPTGMKAFYREYTRENGTVVQLFEALLGIYYSPYNGEKGKWGIKLLKGRKGNIPDTSRAFKYINIRSVPDAMFFEELVHKRKEFLLSNFIENSDWQLLDIINFDSTQVYEIGFDQKDNVQKALFKGRIFIETRTLAIVRVEYGASPKGIDFDKYNKKQAADDEVHNELVDYHVTMNYKRRDSTWYLNDIIGDYEFQVTRNNRDPGKVIDSKLAIHGEMLITDIDTRHVTPISESHRTDWIFNKINNYDPNYWEHINYIVPSLKIKAIADTLNDIK